jgi:hypothetical protein
MLFMSFSSLEMLDWDYEGTACSWLNAGLRLDRLREAPLSEAAMGTVKVPDRSMVWIEGLLG